jgi:hypothetical protein
VQRPVVQFGEAGDGGTGLIDDRERQLRRRGGFDRRGFDDQAISGVSDGEASRRFGDVIGTSTCPRLPITDVDRTDGGADHQRTSERRGDDGGERGQFGGGSQLETS